MTAVIAHGTLQAGGELTRAAHDKGWEVLDRIRHSWTRCRDNGVPNPVDPTQRVEWHPLSWEAGDLGMALAYSVAAQLAPDDGWDREAHVHAAAALLAYRMAPGLGVGLFSGTAGVAWTLQALSAGGARYRTAITGLEETLVERTNTVLDDHQALSTLPTDAYDMVNGLAGVAWYLLHSDAEGLVLDRRTPHVQVGERGRLLDRVVNELARRASALDRGQGLATAPEQITPVERTYFPYLHQGYVNLGFAHGISGVLAVLGRARSLGYPDLDEPISTLQATLLSGVQRTPHGPDVAYYLTPDRKPQQTLSRSAWCYGNPGLAVALASTGAPDQPVGTVSAASLYHAATQRSRQAQDIDNPSLCHGYGGLALIGRHLDQPIEDTLATILDFSNPAAAFGMTVQHAQGHVVDSPGLLEGSGGVAAALLAPSLPPDMKSPTELLITGRRNA